MSDSYTPGPVDEETLRHLTEYYTGDVGDDANIRDLVAAVRERDERIRELEYSLELSQRQSDCAKCEECRHQQFMDS